MHGRERKTWLRMMMIGDIYYSCDCSLETFASVGSS